MSIHKEIAFEDEICEYLGLHGGLYVEGDASRYDRARALFPEDVLAWVQTTQPVAVHQKLGASTRVALRDGHWLMPIPGRVRQGLELTLPARVGLR